jgi:hypothetical protein
MPGSFCDEAAVMQGYAGGIASVTETSELSALLLNPPDPAMREIYLMAYAMEIRMGSGASRQIGLGMLPADLKAEVESRLDSALSEFQDQSQSDHLASLDSRPQ